MWNKKVWESKQYILDSNFGKLKIFLFEARHVALISLLQCYWLNFLVSRALKQNLSFISSIILLFRNQKYYKGAELSWIIITSTQVTFRGAKTRFFWGRKLESISKKYSFFLHFEDIDIILVGRRQIFNF